MTVTVKVAPATHETPVSPCGRRVGEEGETVMTFMIWGISTSHDPYVVDGVCVLRFDNKAGKGDHFHRGEAEAPYLFTSLEQLLADFWTAVNNWSK